MGEQLIMGQLITAGGLATAEAPDEVMASEYDAVFPDEQSQAAD